MYGSPFRRVERVVRVGERRFVCRPPTLEALVRLLMLYPLEVQAIQGARLEHPELPATLDDLLPLFLADRARAATVLEACVALHGGVPGEARELLTADAGALEAIARAVVALCDVEALARDLPPPHAKDSSPPELPADEQDSTWDIALCGVGRAFGVPPHELYAWPAEAVLAAIRIVRLQELRGPAHEASAPRPAADIHASAEQLAVMGWPVQRAVKPEA